MSKSKKIAAVALIVIAFVIIALICIYNMAGDVETITGGTLI